MKVRKAKSFNREDFEADYADLAEKIGEYLNNFTLDVGKIFEKQISFDNLNQDLITFKVTSNGTAQIETQQIKRNSSKKIIGTSIIRILTLKGSNPTTAPFLIWDYNEKYPELITVTSILGLSNNSEYEITAILHGE